MSIRRITTLTAAAATTLAALALTGCSNPDAPGAGSPTTATPASAARNAGEPPGPAPTPAASQAPLKVQPTPQAALTAFAELYINWSYHTLNAQQRTLAAISIGAARLAEQQAAASSAADSTIGQGQIHNSGQVTSLAPELTRRGMWVIVTREQTGGDTQYEGLPSAYHVTLARLARVPGGYAVSEWLPQT
jgi:hypothetical protein